MQWLRNLDIGQDSRRAIKAECGRIIVLEIEGHSVTDIVLQLLERRAFGDSVTIGRSMPLAV